MAKRQSWTNCMKLGDKKLLNENPNIRAYLVRILLKRGFLAQSKGEIKSTMGDQNPKPVLLVSKSSHIYLQRTNKSIVM